MRFNRNDIVIVKKGSSSVLVDVYKHSSTPFSIYCWLCWMERKWNCEMDEKKTDRKKIQFEQFKRAYFSRFPLYLYIIYCIIKCIAVCTCHRVTRTDRGERMPLKISEKTIGATEKKKITVDLFCVWNRTMYGQNNGNIILLPLSLLLPF